MGLAYLVASGDALAIFDYFTSSVTVFGSLTWISILASHVGFMRGMKAQGLSRDTLPYKAVRLFKLLYGRCANNTAIPAILDLLCPILHLRPHFL
jgi:amino acid permease